LTNGKLAVMLTCPRSDGPITGWKAWPISDDFRIASERAINRAGKDGRLSLSAHEQCVAL
jgi:hypothetical protein